ncbi:NADPH dehydrogenase NamA [Tissierella creatinophila]|uniref:NADPH dehydrogenase n=1 Tax=Tissierella creatinophila DSM 6911 TaxID=1123403 RepID=A0A1U7M8R1_TISCR|nr:NADPH dehydrogenase NamA [Tissierella creatinophila]OLS03687.1 NADPH dehydrogenase [Tissierella creatinophila DSM 6911]
MKTFEKFEIKDLTLKNRIVMAPMCTYSSDEDGLVKDFHRVHYGSRAIGGTGLIIVEAAAIIPNGRISNRDLGIWDDNHIEGLKSLVENVHEYDSKIAIQLAHAGRKSDSEDEYIVAPSEILHSENYKLPYELKSCDIKDLIIRFKDGARRALEAGFDAIEIHAAHGYLIHEFLSPITNKRVDEYGGSLGNRTRFLKEILLAIKEVWPKEKPILVRFSATDYKQGGIDKDEIVDIINEVKEYFDIAHISTGGLVDVDINTFPGYQVSFAERVKKKCSIPTISVGLIENFNQIEEILSNNRSDLVALGRKLLRDPYAPLHMAYDQNIDIDFPLQYKRAYR